MKTEKKEINGPFRIMKLLEGWRWEDHSQKRFDTIAEAKKELKRLVAIAREYGEDLDVRFSKLCIAYDVGFRVKTMNTIELFPERCR